jgi:hypothetical protein
LIPMPDFSVFCKNPPAQRCHACGSRVPEDDELCPDCGYFLASYDLGEDPDDSENVDEDVDISDALEDMDPGQKAMARNFPEILRAALPQAATVYGWWDREGVNTCAAWFWDRGWFATITRIGDEKDGLWDRDRNAVVQGALRSMVGPYSSLRALTLSARYDEYGKLGGLPAAEAGAIVWGLLRLLGEQDRAIITDQVRTRSRHVAGRKRVPTTLGIELP